MRRVSSAFLAMMFVSSGALADGESLAGSMWTCARARDGSQFIITFYPSGGVGGGELDGGEVSPYVFDASKTKKGSWPGQWKQTGTNFTWDFPDQHMVIEGRIGSPERKRDQLTGTENALGLTSAIECRIRRDLPKIGAGLVIPKDGHFMDEDDTEGELKVPTGVSLQSPGAVR
ncbi:hypothetical protein [Microvirga sp. 2TAF3]|uniref:hypothetical protein n=1 Tax=Microvirga sp. 2TAF3 TaxID=3233014 RepID=UPI003F9D12AC